jgi:hypothetical protein
MNADAGQIVIDLCGGVSVGSTRPAAIGRLFRGKTPAEAKALMRLLFAVCGAAHEAACDKALAAASGGEPGSSSGAVEIEAIREHLMRIAVDWARAVGEAPEPHMLRAIHGLVRMDRKAALRDARLIMQLLAAAPERVLRDGIAALEGCDSVAARLLKMVDERGWRALGATGDVAEETTCFTLMRPNPLVAGHGNGLTARLASRIVHLAALLAGAAIAGASPGEVITARGALRHRATVSRGIIEDYEIVAPTDVNFAPDGPARRSLAALASARPDDLERPARLLIEAYDPCVAYSLRVH